MRKKNVLCWELGIEFSAAIKVKRIIEAVHKHTQLQFVPIFCGQCAFDFTFICNFR